MIRIISYWLSGFRLEIAIPLIVVGYPLSVIRYQFRQGEMKSAFLHHFQPET
ncbi:MAG: hypothetical protein IPL27_22465 [Lewinellaceae bacterium]|nr:hypothetical protein [Lewinellaceae bacterium]